jgi:ADP-heptose:LPS heptosyltransferase
LASISPEAQARELLGYCLRGERWPRGLVDALRGSEALLRVTAEGLSDRFEPRLCDAYAELFAEAFELGPAAVERYRRIRAVRRIARIPRRVAVLSRITLGADVAVTSILIDAAKRAFSGAEIAFVGPTKNWELFGADARVTHLPIAYQRRDPLGHASELRARVSEPGTVVIDPDSRLTQLGLLPVCPEEHYYFFDSRGSGGEGGETLGALARRWSREVFGVEGRPFVAPVERVEVSAEPTVAVSLGVGGNLVKRLPDPFEGELIRLIAAAGTHLWIDRGAGGEEAARVDRATACFPHERLRVWEGSFAGFASIISQSGSYIGYDSAGQHVAAACGIPLLTIFAGFPAERFFARWSPSGPGRIEVVRGDDPDGALERARRFLQSCRFGGAGW